jgi:hypothetical protein
MTDKSADRIRGSFACKGYYVNHHENKSHSRKMRLEINQQWIANAKTARKWRAPEQNIQLRLRENTSLRSGGCETGITLTIEQAKQLAEMLSHAIYYALPDIRGLAGRSE